MGTPEYALRPATSGDTQFVYELRRAVYRRYVERTWGQWDEQWQRDHFKAHFAPASPMAVHQVICIDAQPVGHLEWGWAPAAGLPQAGQAQGGQPAAAQPAGGPPARLFLGSIEVLPAWQNRGIGTAVIRGLIALAQSRRLPVELQVLKVNEAARRLYERMGFAVIGSNQTHHMMRLTPAGPAVPEGPMPNAQ